MIGRFLEKLDQNPRLSTLLQFIKFGLVGVSNTAISYAVEMLCYYVLFVSTDFRLLCTVVSKLGISLTAESARIIITSILAFVVSVTNSYYWNNKHVFASGKRKTAAQHVRTYLKTAACYALTGLVFSPWAKTLLVSRGIPYWLSTLLVLVVTIPLNFVMNKLWAFRTRPEG